MKKLFSFFIFLTFSFNSAFGYFSHFLNLSTNSLEYQMLQNPEKFSLYEAALLASGVKEDHLPEYFTFLSNITKSTKQVIQTKQPLQKAEAIFDLMHKQILKNYVESATTLDVVLKEGNFNCLSSTLLYNSLLEENGFTTVRTVILPTHAFTQLEIGTNIIDVENTTPFGFDISANPQAQETLKKLTGFTYTSSNKNKEIVGNRGLLAYTYANRAFFAQKAKLPYLSFQSALKSFALKPDGGQFMTNLLAAYTSYPAFLIDSKHDYTQAMAILEEAIDNLGEKTDLINNYKAALDREINEKIQNSEYQKADELYSHAQQVTGDKLISIRMNQIIRTLHRLIRTETNWTLAYNIITNARQTLPSSKDLDNITLNGFYEVQKAILYHWSDYPKGKTEILKWYKLSPTDQNFQSILDDYFSTTAINFYEKKNDPNKAIRIMQVGLKTRPSSVLLKNNLAYVAGNIGISYLKKQSYRTAIDYLKTALDYSVQKGNMQNNLKIAYREWAYTEIDAQHWKNALEVTLEGLKSFPTDRKLEQYERYIKRHLKK